MMAGRADWPMATGRAVRGLLAVVAVGVGLVVVSIPKAQATIPNDQRVVSVSGSLTSMTSDPPFQPAFSPSIQDYAVYCKSGVNLISFTFGGVTPAVVHVSLGENQATVVQASNGSYWVRCLPHDFPVMRITGSASAMPGYYLTADSLSPSNPSSQHYAMVLDSNGTPVWYQAAPGGALNVEALPNGSIAWMSLNGPGFGADPSVGYTIYNLATQTTTTLKAPISPTDFHELTPMPKGDDYMMIGTPIAPLASPFNGYNAIVDCVVQEVSPQGQLVWSWRASDHVALSEAVHASPASVNGQTVLDAFHCNSIDVDPTTGNLLVSLRHTSAVYLVQRTNSDQDGRIKWKLEGCGNNQVGPDLEPVLTLAADPEGCFDAQHDARFLPDGDISMYDDHTYQQGGGARGVEYSIDTQNSTATWVWQAPSQPDGANALATGSFRSYDGGKDNLIGWGFLGGSGFTEVDANGNPFLAMTFPNGELEYRVVKVPLTALDPNILRATAGLPRPKFPTVGWASLGGTLTSKPAVAAWSSNRLDVFVRGTDGQLWHKFWNGTGWSLWEPLGGRLYPGTGPAVASWGPGRLDVFAEGTDRQLYHRWYTSSGWSAWEPLGGVLTSGPAAASPGPGQVDVVVAGTDHGVWLTSFSAGRWTPWHSLGGQTTGDPAIAPFGGGRLDVFVDGTDGQLWHSFFVPGVFWGWESLGGNLTTGPSATSLSSGLLDVVAAGAGAEPQRRPYNAGWQVWQPLLGATTQPPAVVPFQGGEDVFVAGTDNALWFGPIR
jgi:hypothetical protein